MSQLTRCDYERALSLVQRVAEQSSTAARFGLVGVSGLTEPIASDLATLSVCDLRSGHRQVIGLPGHGLSATDIEAFDRYFFSHPLVRYHGLEGGRSSWRISDSLSSREFRDSELYNEYYRRIGIRHAMAIPVLVAQGNLVSFVLNRSSRDFSDRDRARANLVRPILSALYEQACTRTRLELQADHTRADDTAAAAPTMLPRARKSALSPLTAREREVLLWVSRGKTDRDVARLLDISPRTVAKHLEHVYVKLGVETRTAAAMRAVAEWDALA